jgi:hypothetical protein
MRSVGMESLRQAKGLQEVDSVSEGEADLTAAEVSSSSFLSMSLSSPLVGFGERLEGSVILTLVMW